jgi:hypothetical protein
LRWTDKPAEFQQAVYANCRRLQRAKSRMFQKLRSERVERTFAHICDTGGMRRSWLKQVVNVSKRYLLAAAAHNLGRILRKLFGAIGKPRCESDFTTRKGRRECAHMPTCRISRTQHGTSIGQHARCLSMKRYLKETPWVKKALAFYRVALPRQPTVLYSQPADFVPAWRLGRQDR